MRRLPLAWLAAGLAAALAPALPAAAEEGPSGIAELDCTVFEAPRLQARRSRAQLPLVPLFRDGRYAEAEAMLETLASEFPDWADVDYNRAAAQARQGRVDEALDSLAAAVDKGFRDLAQMQRDPDFASIRDRERFTLLLASVRLNAAQFAAATSPAMVAGGTAFVAPANTAYDDKRNLLFSFFRFADKPESETVHGGPDMVGRLLDGWARAGTAAGNHGDIYDNRDRGHSRLNPKEFPQLAHIAYSDCARRNNIDYGLNNRILFNAITIGNSSTALTGGPIRRSQPRLALTTPGSVVDLVLQAANNHLYVYPAVMDFDVKDGDMLPVNTPYMLISRGRSGSDIPFLRAAAAILAAFRPEVKNALRAARLITPTVQMIFRRGMAGIASDADYLSGRAHPAAFDGEAIDLVRMVGLAHDLALRDVPPAVNLVVLRESEPKPGIDVFAPPGISEVFLNSPAAIGRIMRGTGGEKRMVVSAEATRDPNGRPLTFRWVVLSGDAGRISIRPQNGNASVAEIVVPWHDRREVPGAPGIASDRIDIGVFADNGAQLSAPAFVSVQFPPNQARDYEGGRVRRIAYDPPELGKRFVDPLLFPRRDWTDVYDYAPDGTLLGWTRLRKGSEERFLADGRKVAEADPAGRPLAAERVSYALERFGPAGARIVETGTGEIERLAP